MKTRSQLLSATALESNGKTLGAWQTIVPALIASVAIASGDFIEKAEEIALEESPLDAAEFLEGVAMSAIIEQDDAFAVELLLLRASYLSYGPDSEAVQDVLEQALELTDSPDLLHLQPAVYDAFAGHLLDIRKAAAALDILNNGYRLACELDLASDALLALRRIADVEHVLGRPDHHRETLSRIAVLLYERGDELSAAERRLAETEIADIEIDPEIIGIDVQPIATTVFGAVGERTRARVTLTNTSTRSIAGRLSFLASNALRATSWTVKNNEVVAEIGIGGGNSRPLDRELRIAAGDALTVWIAGTFPQQLNAEAELVWEDARGGERKVSLTFVAAHDKRRKFVANASLVRLHPCYSVALFQEVPYRGLGEMTQNIRAASSVPCRIELFDDRTGAALAIDAGGDGIYRDSADRLFQNADGDDLPDIALGAKHGQAVVRVLIYPSAETDPGRERTIVAFALADDDGEGGVRNVGTNENGVYFEPAE